MGFLFIQRGGRPVGAGQLPDDYGGGFCAVGAWRRDAGSARVHHSRVWAGDTEWRRERSGWDGCDIHAQASTKQTAATWAGHLGCLRGPEEGVPFDPEACVILCAAEIWCATAFYPGLEAVLHGLADTSDAGAGLVLRHAGGRDGGSRGVQAVPGAVHPGDAGGVRAGGASVATSLDLSADERNVIIGSGPVSL
jgi:hypothetical protein